MDENTKKEWLSRIRRAINDFNQAVRVYMYVDLLFGAISCFRSNESLRRK